MGLRDSLARGKAFHQVVKDHKHGDACRYKGKAKAPEIDLATDVGVGITIKDLMAKEETSYKEAVSVYFAFQDSLKGKRAQPCKDSTKKKKKTAKANPSPPEMDEEPAEATSKKSLARPKSRPSREKPKPASAASGVKRKNACSDLGACEESEEPPAVRIRSKSAPACARTNAAQAPPERPSKKAAKAAPADLAAEDDDGCDDEPDEWEVDDLADGNYPQVLEDWSMEYPDIFEEWALFREMPKQPCEPPCEPPFVTSLATLPRINPVWYHVPLYFAYVTSHFC